MLFVAPVTRGAQSVLAAELSSLGLTPEEGRGAVLFRGDLEDGYRACLWSRIASRVLLLLDVVPARDGDELYEGVRRIPWSDHLPRGRTMAVNFRGTNQAIRNSQFGAFRTKDGIVDRMRMDTGGRPSIDLKTPDLRVDVLLADDHATISIDLAGDPLYKRGYGREIGPAPLNESLAAALLHLAGWPSAAVEGATLADIMCGSGTLLEEAAGIALDRAPGLTRMRWGFTGWRGHEPGIWDTLTAEARQRSAEAHTTARIVGSDIDLQAVHCARDNLGRADALDITHVYHSPMDHADVPPDTGLLVTNPPYGERMHADEDVVPLYRELGDVLRRRWLGWHAWVLAGSPALGRQVGLRPKRRIPIHNGPIDCRFLELPISSEPLHRFAE